MSNWAFISGSSVFNDGASSPVTGLFIPNAGDLCVCAWATYGEGALTNPAISDTGSGGWNVLVPITSGPSDLGNNVAAAAWWKTATAADHNGGAGSTITITGAYGGSHGALTLECDVFRLGAGAGPFGGCDLAAVQLRGSAGTAQSLSPASGSSEPNNTDELAWTFLSGENVGAVTGTNTFAGTSAASTLTNTGVGLSTNTTAQYLLGCQASATAGTNVWVNSWTNSRTPVLIGATFWYVQLGGQIMVV